MSTTAAVVSSIGITKRFNDAPMNKSGEARRLLILGCDQSTGSTKIQSFGVAMI
jgi:hypothetical protein